MPTINQIKYWESMKGHVGYFTGKKHSKKTKQIMSAAKKGICPIWAVEKAIIANKGIKRSPEWCRSNGDRFRGANHYNWKGGETTRLTRKSFYERHRNYLKKNAVGKHSHEQWEEMKLKFNYMCLCCKLSEPKIKLTEDHIVPLSKGGSNDISNIQPLCLSCNSIKLTKTIDYRELFNPTNQSKS